MWHCYGAHNRVCEAAFADMWHARSAALDVLIDSDNFQFIMTFIGVLYNNSWVFGDDAQRMALFKDSLLDKHFDRLFLSWFV